MRKRTLWYAGGAGVISTIGITALLIYSIRLGIAPMTIPIVALVLGPALAAIAMVATCSIVAPSADTQTGVLRPLELRSTMLDETAESAV